MQLLPWMNVILISFVHALWSSGEREGSENAFESLYSALDRSAT